MRNIKVTAFNCSPRPNGNTSMIIEEAFKTLEKAGIETRMVQVGRMKLSGCRACYKCRENADGHCVLDDGCNDLLDIMYASDGILLGSPTYFADVTAECKALIDRAGYVSMANGGLLKRKVGAPVIAVRRGGQIHAFETIVNFMYINQMVIPGSCYWNMGIGRNPGDVLEDEEGLRTMRVLGENMAWLLKRVND